MKLTNDFAAQVRDLLGKVTLLEEEKEKNTADLRKLIRALFEKTIALEENATTFEEKMTALEGKKKKTWQKKEERLLQLKAKLALLRSHEIDQGAFEELVVKKVLQTVSLGKYQYR